MDAAIQTILNQGYMTSDNLLDPLAMRPYINKRGETVVVVRAGIKLNEKSGKPEPIYREKKIFTNALLRKYEWEKIDTEVQDVVRQPLVGFSDLINEGLTNPLGDIGVSISTYEQLGDMGPASVSMTLTPGKGENDRVTFTPQSIPVPIIMKPFWLDMRTLLASRRGTGEGLDVTQVRTATIKVRETLEDMVFNGSSLQVETFKIYGYTNAPHRLADTATNFGGGDFGTDGNAHATISGMIGALRNLGFTGPWGVYVALTQYEQMNNLTGANMSETQLSVIKRTLEDVKFIRPSYKLADGTVLVVQLTKDVVDVAIGMDVAPVSWSEYGGMVNEFRVMGAAVPRIKFDSTGKCGVAQATGA